MKQSDFWKKVDKTDDCWIWTGTKRLGYGIVRVVENGRVTTRGAHRLSYEWSTGQNPGPLFVLHRCDRVDCVKPDHLFLGTHNENSTLDHDLVVKARMLAAAGGNVGELAKSAGVNRHVLYQAVRGKTWKHIEQPPVDYKMPRKVIKLSQEQIQEIREALQTPYHGISKFLAQKYGVSNSMISHIKSGRFNPK